MIIRFVSFRRLIRQYASSCIDKVNDCFLFDYIEWIVIGFSFSGGKDSTYNMIQCVRNGHELIALANLHPKKDIGKCKEKIKEDLHLFWIDELDSYMYQSVGHEMIDLFAQAMELPLYRAEIRGDAQTTEKDYQQPVQGDEVEDLYELLLEVKVRRNRYNQMDFYLEILDETWYWCGFSGCDLFRISK